MINLDDRNFHFYSEQPSSGLSESMDIPILCNLQVSM